MKRTLLTATLMLSFVLVLGAVVWAGGCVPQSCGGFTPDCNPDLTPCYCFALAEGGGYCTGDFLCDTHQSCTTSDDCADGRPCLVDHCCGVGKCGPIECTGATEEGASEGGLSASGNMIPPQQL
ncbi:MAG: hypothetical protein HYR55_05700 [Acidobacteria bacterium]|nr:hypothetical protein [Acidobacteriota bacterium]MBI3656509.1 hypothetical protein [Acidobacteriota bacterium]